MVYMAHNQRIFIRAFLKIPDDFILKNKNKNLTQKNKNCRNSYEQFLFHTHFILMKI